MKVLFVNHSQVQCGVYQFGKRIYDLISPSKAIEYFYKEVESKEEFDEGYNQTNPDIIIYNWYPITMGWLSEEIIEDNKNVKHYFIFHDGHVRQTFDKYIFSGSEGKDISFSPEKSVIIPRPLFTYEGKYSRNGIITVGSFGFGGWQKGFTSLVESVNRSFDKAIINIQMPFAYFGDRDGLETRKISDECFRLNTNPNVVLNISHEFLSNDDILKFLAKNDINVFLYKSSNQGLSSVTDYALSVKRPIAITNDNMFKHVYKDEIDVDKHSILSILERGVSPLKEYYSKWSPHNFGKLFDEIVYK